MANKLAGQRAKFTKAREEFNSTDDDDKKQNATRKMLEVLSDAEPNGFSRADVTQYQEIPNLVLQRLEHDGPLPPSRKEEDPAQLVRAVEELVDTSDVAREGTGPQAVYAYGYRCTPDRLKVGRCDGDVISRIAAQINTSTPDRPALCLVIHTHRCRALEKMLHGALELRGRKVSGGGQEWFVTTRDEVLELYRQTFQPSSAGTPLSDRMLS